ncbi:MAG: endonuclease/exonuclease/phosphatase family protein [Acidobacteria bacterium]|nr:endonuclease/exonuclease/phosphatase family protein [Acidobacteriota bacterium]
MLFRTPVLALLFLGTLAQAGPTPPRPPRGSFCAMTFNIRNSYADAADAKVGNAWPSRRPLALKMLKELAPDLVGIQEATDGQVSDLAPGFEVIRQVELALLYRPERLDALEGGWTVAGEYGRPDRWGDRWIQWQVFRVRATGRRVLVVHTHLSTEADHGPQARKTLAVARERAGGMPVLVMGDFNFDASGLLRSEGFQDAIPDQAGTFHGFKGGREGPRIDFLGTRGLEVLGWGVPQDTLKKDVHTVYISDHHPLWIRVRPSR